MSELATAPGPAGIIAKTSRRLAVALERSELERQALNARLHLLQAQVASHFLFNHGEYE
jgi:sensor histidine kinase YesM